MMLPAGHRRHRVHGAPENLSPHFVPSPPQLFLKAERPGPGMPAVAGSTSWAPWQTDLGTSGKKAYKILSIRVPRHELTKCRLCLSTWNMIKLGIVIHQISKMRPKKWDIPSASASSATTSLGGFFSKKDWPGTFSPEFPHMFSRFSPVSTRFSPDFPRCHVFTAAPHTFPTWPWSHCGAPTFHFQCGHRHRAAQPSSMIFLKNIVIFQSSVELPEGTYIFIFA